MGEKEVGVSKTKIVRIASEFDKDIINYIRIKYIMEGRTPPGAARITKVIATNEKIKEEIYDLFIKF